MSKSRRWGGPRPAPYNPNARDADHDGMVQEGTIWERPGGSKFVDRLGKEITAAAARTSPGSFIADSNGNRLDYTPSWQRGGAPGAPGEGDLSAIGGRPSLGDLGYPSIGDTGGSIRDTNGTVEGLPDLTPDPRDVEQVGPDGVGLPDGETAPQVPILSGPEVEAARQRLAEEITKGALQGSNWTRSDGRGVGDGLGPEFAVEPVARFDLDDETTAKIAELGGTVFPVYEVASDLEGATEFQDAIQYAHDTHKFGTSVDVYDLKDYQGDGIRLFLSPDKKVGYAVKSDGQLVSVFNADDTTQMPLHTIVPLSLSQGATRADAFDTVLPGFYAHFGLQPTARIPFDDDYKPDGWNYSLYDKYNNGKPDVVFMRFDPDRVGVPYVPGDGDFVADYDAGLASTEPIPEVPGIDVYPEEVADKDGVYDAVRSLVADPPDPDGNWVFTGSKAVIDDHGDEAEGALTAYIQNSLPINNSLRDDSVSPENQKVVDTFDALFEALPPSEGGVVYRGAPMRTLLGETDGIETEGELDALIEETIGTVITDDGILSTSSLPEVAVDFSTANRSSTDPEGYLVLEIDIPEGGEALGISKDPGRGEREVLLPRGIEYEVTGVKKVRREGDHPTYVVKVAQKQRSSSVAEEAVTEAVEADAVVDRVAEAVTPITEVGATDLGRHLRAGYGGPREASWDTLKKWGPGDSDLTRRYSINPSGLNSKLRSGDLTPEDVEFADALSEYIGQARTERPYTVYRGLPATTLLGDIPEDEMDDAVKALVGEVVTDDGFLSASASINTASEFMYRHKDKKRVEGEESGVLMRIAVPRGAEGGLAVQSPYQEQEVLYERGTKLQVTGVSKLPNLDDREKPVYVLNTELVPPDVAEGEAPPLIQEVTSFTDHDKAAPFHGLEAHLVETSRDGTVFSGFQSGAIVGRDYPRDSAAEDTLRRLIGEEVELPEGASVTASPSEALEAAAVRPGPYYKPRESSQVAMKINLPEGVDEIPEGATLRVIGVEKSQPPGMRRSADPYTPNYPAEPPTFVVEVDVVPGSDVQGQELSRTAAEVADDIAAVVESISLTERIERSILGET